MRSAGVRLYRDSASLIILAKNQQFSNDAFNYKILSLKRTEKTSFMPNHIVFPGGVCESSDQSRDWINHFKKFGVKQNRLEEITKIRDVHDRPSIFESKQSDPIKKEISLRITAIRETFEELGILICRNKNEINDETIYGKFFGDTEKLKEWQKIIHNDSNRFLELCEKMEVVPDLWSLYEWSVWMTPAFFQKRFQTAFFIVALNQIPDVIPEPHEVQEYLWKNPVEYLSLQKDEKLFLPPPQVYEFLRILKYSDLSELANFAKERNDKGSTLLLPVQIRCSDGIAGVLPGDDAYPSDPNEVQSIDNSTETLEEFRQRTKSLHRSEHRSFFSIKYFLNFKPFNEHLSPVLEDNVTSKL